MTLRLRPFTRPARRGHVSAEDRQQFWVTAGFITLIIVVVLTLVGAVAVGYWNDHLKPIATVGAVQIDRDDWIEHARLMVARIDRSEALVREAVTSAEIDSTVAQERLGQLRTARQAAPDQAIDELIDLIYKEQLAAQEGISATPEEVDEAVAKEASRPERRHVQAIFVEPETDAAGEEPTAAQRREALEQAEKALTELEDGEPFDEVAQRYSTDISRENGGDYGIISQSNPTDDAWVAALFELDEEGTTDIVEGADGVYRIGRVTEVMPGGPDPAFTEDIRAVGISDAGYRTTVQREVVADKLEDDVIAEATEGDAEQVRLSEIFILISDTTDPATDEGEVHASHILYSPNDDSEAARTLAAEDPAWDEAERDARAADAALREITDGEDRATAFAARARAESDDRGSGANGGDLGFFARGRMVPQFADPLFDIPRTENEIVGPVRSEFGYHVILFHEFRPPAEERINAVIDDLEEPDADFATVAREHSDGDEAEEGGDIGWKIREQLDAEAADAVFELDVGERTDSIELDDGYHVYRVADKEERPLDAEQRSAIRGNAFTTWYAEQKSAAETAGTITKDPETFSPAAIDADPLDGTEP
jgi:parvulin-like peptidyl-prolyl isomerase